MESHETKLNFKDVTFLIRIRVDSMDRLENLLMVVDYIRSHFDTHIHVMETATYKNHILENLLHEETTSTFEEDYDPIYHYTKYMNMMVKNCDTKFIAVWEADVIIPVEQMAQSINLLRKDKADFVSPYKEKAFDTTHILRELYFRTQDISTLQENKGKMIEMYSPNPVGGGFLANRNTYIEAGMENERFYGWGREDGERINRWKILGYRYKRINGPLFHLTHERGINSQFHSSKQDDIKASEVFRLYAMSKEEMLDEIKKW